MPDDGVDSGAADAPLIPLSEPTQEPVRIGPGGSQKGRKIRQPTELLRDMRWAYKHPRKKGEIEPEELTAGRQQCRQLQESDQIEFMKTLRDLERLHMASKPKASSTASSGPGASPGTGSGTSTDPREESVLALIAELRAKVKEPSP